MYSGQDGGGHRVVEDSRGCYIPGVKRVFRSGGGVERCLHKELCGACFVKLSSTSCVVHVLQLASTRFVMYVLQLASTSCVVHVLQLVSTRFVRISYS